MFEAVARVARTYAQFVLASGVCLFRIENVVKLFVFRPAE
jgi:hypothetical protein